MRCVLASALLLFGLLLSTTAFAVTQSPVGTWIQVDDSTHKPKSIIQITQLPDGSLQAVVKRVIFSKHGTHPVCDKCEGKRHNQPVVGMVIMWGVKKTGDNEWSGGKILDPAKGKTYKVKLSLDDHGKKLDVRGYIGISLFGRTQTWRRKTASSTPALPAA